MPDLEGYLDRQRRRIDGALETLLPPQEGPAATVARAMRHALMGGGKRLRPALAIAAYEACGRTDDRIVKPAAALEMIHTYSLVHDDLPAMDDDDLRRGRPTVHRAFGDAVAILAGDGLLTLAFEVLGCHPEGDEVATARTRGLVVVARAAGVSGMVGGQIADLESEQREIDGDRLRWIHLHKTGALFAGGAELGGIHAGADADRTAALRRFGRAVGLAFQIADDILDRTASAADLGKTPGKDERSGKATYPGLFGVDTARRMAREALEEARSMLEPLGLLSEPLSGLAAHALSRTR